MTNTSKAPRKNAETTPQRIVRLLSLVAHLTARGEISVAELAEHYGVGPEQIRKDIDLLWVTGTPGYMPDDLVDFDAYALEAGIVKLTADRGLSRSLQLGTREAIALVAALNSLREIVADGAPAHHSADTYDDNLTAHIDDLTTKLSLRLGHNARALDVQLSSHTVGPTLTTLRTAITNSTLVDIDYVSNADQRTTRTIEPAAIFNERENFYLQAFCHKAQDDRVFRIDRIIEARALAGTHFEPRPLSGPAQAQVPKAGELAHLVLRPQGQWIAESLPYESLEYQADGSIALNIDVADWNWFHSVLLSHPEQIVNVTPRSTLKAAVHEAERTLELYEQLANSASTSGASESEPLGEEE
ncbi:helix-turn-helix transcriptional regulator [Timonella senegalensis]|uniref:helix-turn-helix transcriptional regulator n=1 Tax=Timonella senegalensis TaxID=1465825 RepID=UPI002FDDC633